MAEEPSAAPWAQAPGARALAETLVRAEPSCWVAVGGLEEGRPRREDRDTVL